MRISIENPAGSYREGTDSDGKKWRSLLHYDYGYIRGTSGVDKDHVDCFLGPNQRDSQDIFIIHQKDVKTGKYDEDKVMIGWLTQTEAVRDYLKNYDRRDMYLGCTKMGIDEFKLKCPRTNDKARKITSDTPMHGGDKKGMVKAKVRAHVRRTKSGKVVPVREHTDIRAAAHISVSVGDTWNSPRGKVTVNKIEGDRTFASYADSPSINHIIRAADLERRIKQDEQHAARASKQAVAAEEAAKPKRYSTDEFTNRIGGIAGGRAKKVLQTQMGLNGKHDTRANHIEKLVSAGYTVKTDNPKKERRLTSPSGSFFNQRSITQTGMDYAEHLVSGKRLSKAHVKAHTRMTRSGKVVPVREHEDSRTVHQEMHQRSVKAEQKYQDWLRSQPEAVKEAKQLAEHYKAGGGQNYKEGDRREFQNRWTSLYARRDKAKGAAPYVKFSNIGQARPTKTYSDFGISYEFWEGETGYGIKVKDTDSGNVIHLVTYPKKSKAKAEQKYAETVAAVRKAAQ